MSSSATQRTRVPATPRLRTRLFAARCLLDIPVAVGEDPHHFDASLLAHKASAAASASSNDWLVLELAQLIDIGFKMATGQVEALRVLGLRLLKVKCLSHAILQLFPRSAHRILLSPMACCEMAPCCGAGPGSSASRHTSQMRQLSLRARHGLGSFHMMSSDTHLRCLAARCCRPVALLA